MSNIYNKLNVKTFINAAGTYTVVGGSRMSEKTLQDMVDAARNHVEIRELQRIVHEKLAKLTNNEAAYISNGAACGIYLTIAACVSLKEKKLFNYISKERLQELEVITFRSHRNPYDRGIKEVGVKLVELGYPNIILPATKEDLDNTITKNTIAIFFVAGSEGSWVPAGGLTLEDTLEISKRKNIPVIVDAAAQLPPVENLWNYTQMGADIALFSGGKDLKGPQASGLIVGKKTIINEITKVGFPNYSIGRMLKVGREEIVGLYSAVEQYVTSDHSQRLRWCEEQIELLRVTLESSQLFKIIRTFPNEAGQPIPRAFVEIQNNELLSPSLLQEMLFEGVDSIFTTSENKNGVYINPMTLNKDEINVIINKFQHIEQRLLN